MSALTFSLKQTPAQRLDLSPLVSQNLHGLSLAEIAALELQNGKARRRVDEVFEISGEDVQNIVFNASSDKLDFIGKQLEGGSITVNGDAGAYLGLSMKGGTILVKGNAGARVGDHMRRGYILIEGNTGDYCGSRMLAGTIAVMGDTGRYLGYAMRRGTLLLWKTPSLSATFNDCGSHTLAFLPILFASFKTLNSRFADSSLAFNRVRRYGGDMAETGRGEVLVKL